MLLPVLLSLIVTNADAAGLPFTPTPLVPQICRITYGVQNSSNHELKRFALCLGTLVGAPRDTRSSWLATAGHCAPELLFASFLAQMKDFPDAIRDSWGERLANGHLAIHLDCGAVSERVIPQTVVHPAYSDVMMWLGKKMMHRQAGPYPVDLALLKLPHALPLAPLPLSTLTREQILKNREQCLITSLSPNRQKIGFHLGTPLMEEEPFPLLAVEESAGPILNEGDSGGPLLCLEHGRYRLAGVNSLSFQGLNASFIQDFTPEIRSWFERMVQPSGQTTGQAD